MVPSTYWICLVIILAAKRCELQMVMFCYDLFHRKSLCSVTSLYFWNTEAAAERSLVLVGGSFCFVLALGLLLIDESNLEIGLDAAYSSFNKSASVFLERQSMDSEYNILYSINFKSSS